MSGSAVKKCGLAPDTPRVGREGLDAAARRWPEPPAYREPSPPPASPFNSDEILSCT